MPNGAIDRRNGRLAELVRTQRNALMRFFGRHAADRSDLPDLVQDVYLKLARAQIPDTLDNPAGYVISVARSVLIDHHRRRRVRHADAHDELDHDIADTDSSIERVLDGKAAAERMQAALLELPQRTQDVFGLRSIRGMRMSDVAGAMGISLSTAEKHHARALAHLAARLIDFRP